MRRVVFALFGTIAGLVGLLSFKTHAVSVAAPSVATGTTNPGTGASGPSSSVAAGPSSSTGSSSSSAATKTVTGASVDTRWGPVQVKITVSGGKITNATAVVYPQNNSRDQEINAVAIPTLQQESVGRNNANIDMVSGATYTSQGFIGSLQDALNQAGL
ncbi:MAG: hypothetical protein QOF92_1936 [Pseudonocardiales bacterium]|nr:hypothetical protein [Pseudonocardiales bacterium]